MPRKTAAGVSAEVKARARAAREKFRACPPVPEILSPEELAEATPFYFALRKCVGQLRAAREAAGLTLAQVGEKTGLAAETLSRLETGALTNPTFKTLALYARVLGRRLTLSADA